MCLCVCAFMSRLYGTLIMVLESFIHSSTHPSVHPFVRSYVRVFIRSLNVFLLYILFIFQIFRSLEEPFEEARYKSLLKNVSDERTEFIAYLTQLMNTSNLTNRSEIIRHLESYESVCILASTQLGGDERRKRRKEKNN